MKLSLLRSTLFVFLLAPGVAARARAQQPADPPVPSQFASAHTAFLGFAGAPPASGAEDSIKAMYASLYRAFISDGHYTLTASPRNADILVEFCIVVNVSDAFKGSSTSTPGVQLNFIDPTSHATLWTLTVPVDTVFRKSSVSKATDDAASKLMAELDDLIAGKIPSAPKRK